MKGAETYMGIFNPLPAEFIKWNNPLSILGITRWELEVGKPTV